MVHNLKRSHNPSTGSSRLGNSVALRHTQVGASMSTGGRAHTPLDDWLSFSAGRFYPVIALLLLAKPR